ncbi:MAG: hypothetical protein GDA56_17235 [Hormoscilla sp. GM7CHS1pb]|nr:hypothetical protein [Hormoscilla sp. GM7CHS1pb]
MSNINLWRTASLLSCLEIATAASSLSAQAQTSESLPPLSTTVSFPGSALTTAEALMDQPPTSHSHQTRSENTSENNAVIASGSTLSFPERPPMSLPAGERQGGRRGNDPVMSLLRTTWVGVSGREAQRRRDPDRPLADTYLGIGADMGLDGDTALGESGFAAVGKLGFTDNLSLRTASSFGDGVVLMLSVAYDFPIDREPFESIVLAPFVGGGVAFEIDEGYSGPPISGGVDYPVSKDLTATARINIAFLKEETTDVGIILGIAYNFPALINR